MKLYLEKRGCDFSESDQDARKRSDLGNYRLFLEFIDKDGRRVCGDVTRGELRAEKWNKNGTSHKTIVTTRNGLYTHFCYEDHTGCYGYNTGPLGDEFTQESVLRLVNKYSAITYDSIEIVDILPDAAHEYPESVLDLERTYLAGEHAAMVKETEQHIQDKFLYWYDGLQRSFSDMSPDEYKRCTLLAFRLMSDRYGIISEKPVKQTPGTFTAHRMSKHFFEGQHFIDPYADAEFLFQLEKYSPYYVGRYLPEMTLEEFASRIVKV